MLIFYIFESCFSGRCVENIIGRQWRQLNATHPLKLKSFRYVLLELHDTCWNETSQCFKVVDESLPKS